MVSRWGERQLLQLLDMFSQIVVFCVLKHASIGLMEHVCPFYSDQISVYAVPEKIDQTALALDAAVKLLDFYDDYFDIPYPLPKQGQWKYLLVWSHKKEYLQYLCYKKKFDPLIHEDLTDWV